MVSAGPTTGPMIVGGIRWPAPNACSFAAARTRDRLGIFSAPGSKRRVCRHHQLSVYALVDQGCAAPTWRPSASSSLERASAIGLATASLRFVNARSWTIRSSAICSPGVAAARERVHSANDSGSSERETASAKAFAAERKAFGSSSCAARASCRHVSSSLVAPDGAGYPQLTRQRFVVSKLRRSASCLTRFRVITGHRQPPGGRVHNLS